MNIFKNLSNMRITLMALFALFISHNAVFAAARPAAPDDVRDAKRETPASQIGAAAPAAPAEKSEREEMAIKQINEIPEARFRDAKQLLHILRNDVLRYQNLRIFEAFLARGPKLDVHLNNDNETIFSCIINYSPNPDWNKKKPFLDALLDAHEDSKLPLNVNLRDRSGKTMLMYAISVNDIEMAQRLLDLKPDLGIADDTGRTALFMANRAESIKLLLDAVFKTGMNVQNYIDARDIYENTALFYLVEAILEDRKYRNVDGFNAREDSRRREFAELKRAILSLIENGANSDLGPVAPKAAQSFVNGCAEEIAVRASAALKTDSDVKNLPKDITNVITDYL